jgi:hypothetical protein
MRIAIVDKKTGNRVAEYSVVTNLDPREEAWKSYLEDTKNQNLKKEDFEFVTVSDN